MATLASDLRSKLERVVVEARDVAEAGACAALEALAVHEARYYPHMSLEQQKVRNQLRARARQLGDKQEPGGQLAIDHLAGECAYEHWHRMLFARFLAENGLLIEAESGMAISLAEAEELSKEAGEDVWTYASRCAERMLPQIFRPDDPLLQVALATEHRVKLEQLLDSLTQEVFTASDALGWVYQFWQTKRKKEVNDSEVKIGADEIGPVTQLFTEPYMVQFLLDNTLGAWWAGKNLKPEVAETAESEQEVRQKLVLPGVPWDYLRFVRGPDGKGGPWRPAAGTFGGWPRTAKEITILDPCCGSGHFLVAALQHLVPMRIAEEHLSARETVDAVLRDNIHGLEIDERCCQIAAFALAFAAWTYPGAGGYRSLPELQIACSGIGPQCSADQWVKLAEESGIRMPAFGREAIKNGLLNLHRLFSQAPTLGSLINAAELPADLIAADYETIQPYLTAIRKVEKADDETRERAIAAAGMVKAADLLAGDYTLVITNPPFLGTYQQDDSLVAFCGTNHPLAKKQLALVFMDRCYALAATTGTIALVVPQDWLFLKTYGAFRRQALTQRALQLVARLGPRAFSTPMWDFNVMMLVSNAQCACEGHHLRGCDASNVSKPALKATELPSVALASLDQHEQLHNPACSIILAERESHPVLRSSCSALSGCSAGDREWFVRQYWEVPRCGGDWQFHQTTPSRTEHFSGREEAVYWQDGMGVMADLAESVKHLNHAAQNWRKGKPNWGKQGVVVSLMGGLPVALYGGDIYASKCTVIVPEDQEDPVFLAALWAFCSSCRFAEEVRKLSQKLAVEVKTLLEVPFDLAHWQKVAAEKHPHGLPEPESDDPRQWLFHGRPDEAPEGAELQVGVVRLLGYRWPAELDDEMHLSERARALVKRCDELLGFADPDGIVCIPSVRGEEPAAKQLEALLVASGVDADKVRELTGATDLDEWLHNAFFEEHCKLFHDRPFVWHIWDGRKRDGFHALVNYHKLCEGDGKGRKLLESLTYSYLGDWIARQEDGVRRGEEGAEGRLAAALELRKRLESILEGEPPFDIFVRWKPLAEQPVGWEPDINDGVRLNIRPFLASDLPNGKKGAGILRSKPNIKWGKDRGKEPQRAKADYPWFWSWDEKTEDFAGGEALDGNRWNDCHYTRKARQDARDRAEGVS